MTADLAARLAEIDCDGSPLQYVLIRGFSAIGFALPLQAANDALDEIARRLEADRAAAFRAGAEEMRKFIDVARAESFRRGAEEMRRLNAILAGSFPVDSHGSLAANPFDAAKQVASEIAVGISQTHVPSPVAAHEPASGDTQDALSDVDETQAGMTRKRGEAVTDAQQRTQAKVDRALDGLEALADQWAAEIGLTSVIKNTVSPMDINRNTPADVRAHFNGRMEAQIDAIARQAFIEGAYRAVCGMQDVGLTKRGAA